MNIILAINKNSPYQELSAVIKLKVMLSVGLLRLQIQFIQIDYRKKIFVQYVFCR